MDSDPENKAVNYSIIAGDHLGMFDIHPTDGTIVVRTPLDRESVCKICYYYIDNKFYHRPQAF